MASFHEAIQDSCGKSLGGQGAGKGEFVPVLALAFVDIWLAMLKPVSGMASWGRCHQL